MGRSFPVSSSLQRQRAYALILMTRWRCRCVLPGADGLKGSADRRASCRGIYRAEFTPARLPRKSGARAAAPKRCYTAAVVRATLIPAARPQHDPHHREHDRDLDKHAHDRRERRPRLEPEERDRRRNRELEEVRCPDQSRGAGDIVRDTEGPVQLVSNPGVRYAWITIGAASNAIMSGPARQCRGRRTGTASSMAP